MKELDFFLLSTRKEEKINKTTGIRIRK